MGMLRGTGLVAGLLWATAVGAADFSPEALEFFEKRVRPVFVEHCLKCHGEKQQKGGLRLDSRAAVLQGGDTGPALDLQHVEKSVLVEAISYDPDGYKMPPSGKLPANVIADLTEWVRQGAAWPVEAAKDTTMRSEFDLAERSKHWSFQPVKVVTPPEVSHPYWAANPIDRFIFQKLAAAKLSPAARASRATLLRRLSLELTGLPPTAAELDAFLADESPTAYAKLVDGLLASPHYGERWGRHWLDLVRFAETSGHEFDYDIPFAWPYRDYVIRAFNADLPYDQFITEHLAGDLLVTPRRDPATHINESVIGTAFYWFSQGKHSPVDIRAEECDLIDNQLDVIGKTFQGLTIACARCHDHKFDPITQADYYSLAGFLQSSRQTFADYNPPEATESVLEELHALDQRHRHAALEATIASLKTFVGRLPELLMADPAQLPDVSAEQLTAWRKQIVEEAVGQKEHPLHLWAHWSAAPDQVAQRVQDWRRQPRRTRPDPTSRNAATVLSPQAEDEAHHSPWFRDGHAFGHWRQDQPQWLPSSDPARPITGVVRPETWVHSGLVSPKLRGAFRSPTFTITQKYIDYWVCRHGGSNQVPRSNKVGQVSLIVDGFQFIRNPLYGHLTLNVPDRATPVWMRQDVTQFIGSRAYIEVEDLDDGCIEVDRIEFRDGPPPAETFHELIAEEMRSAPVDTLQDVARAYQTVAFDLLEAVRREQLYGVPVFQHREGRAAADLWNWLLRQPKHLAPAVAVPEAITQYADQRAALERQIPTPRYTIGTTDGSAENESLLIRGNPKKPGADMPRRNLEVFAMMSAKAPEPMGPTVGQPGSGRDEWARSLVDPQNPLTARVIVNRLWQHHFGRGLVPTPDDFGKMGQPPTHPELLDWLAAELIHADWSLKHIQRLIVTSETYQMSSRATDAAAEEADPNNVWLHRQTMQRLEAEAIRDSLLALSGRLDDRLYGPSVLPHLTPFMEGRGRPGSGPLDGDGRRSLYLNVRRNFLSPFFLAFDFPTPFTTMGKRSSSNVPAQALALMNNPLVVQQTAKWAESVRAATDDPAERITRLYREAYGRSPSDVELQAAQGFLAAQAQEYGRADDPRAWNDLAHVLANVKEFVFIE